MQKDFEIDVVRCMECMQTGGIFLYPTDTIWGIGADPRDEAAVERIIQLKKRPGNKSFVILVASVSQLERYVNSIDGRLMDYLNTRSKPTTVIYGGAKGLAPSVIAEDGTVAIRICKEPFCLELINRVGCPVLSTSANLSGDPAPSFFAEMNPNIITGVDYVVKYRREETRKAAPSAIIKWHPERLKANTTDTDISPAIEIIRN